MVTSALTLACLALAVALALVLAGAPDPTTRLVGVALAAGAVTYAAHRYDTRREATRVDRDRRMVADHGRSGDDRVGAATGGGGDRA